MSQCPNCKRLEEENRFLKAVLLKLQDRLPEKEAGEIVRQVMREQGKGLAD